MIAYQKFDILIFAYGDVEKVPNNRICKTLVIVKSIDYHAKVKKWHDNYILAWSVKIFFFISKNKFDINTSQQSCSIWSDFHISFRHSIIYICITSYTHIQHTAYGLISTWLLHKTCLFMYWYIWYMLIILTPSIFI